MSPVWRAPLVLGLLSIVGLLAALLADGPGDVVSWVALAIPVAVAAWYTARPRGDRRSARTVGRTKS